MAVVAQLVRASGCGPESRGFESRLPPQFLCCSGLPMYYVYLLELGNGQFYTGYTSDLKRLMHGTYAWGFMHGVLCMGFYAWGFMHGVLCMGFHVWGRSVISCL